MPKTVEFMPVLSPFPM